MATTTFEQAAIPELRGALRRKENWAASNEETGATCRTDGEPIEDAVITACQNGDRGAQRHVYDSCHGVVFRLAVSIVGLQDAADVTQQVFLQAFRSIGQFQGRSRFETWLYRLAANEALQHLRRNRRRKNQSLDWEPMDRTRDSEHVERKEMLEQALARIDPELRSIFLLREVEGLSYRDIADTLAIPEGTVGSRLNRARRELRQHLGDLGFESS